MIYLTFRVEECRLIVGQVKHVLNIIINDMHTCPYLMNACTTCCSWQNRFHNNNLYRLKCLIFISIAHNTQQEVRVINNILQFYQSQTNELAYLFVDTYSGLMGLRLISVF